MVTRARLALLLLLFSGSGLLPREALAAKWLVESLASEQKEVDLEKVIQVSLSGPKAFKLDERVHFAIEIRNTSRRKQRIAFSQSNQSGFPITRLMYFEVFKDQDAGCIFQQVHENSQVVLREKPVESHRLLELRPGETWHQDFEWDPTPSKKKGWLSKLFSSETGRYRVEMQVSLDPAYQKFTPAFAKLNRPVFVFDRVSK